MNQMERLYDLAERRGIEINDYHFSKTRKSMCVNFDTYKSIAMDKPCIDSILI